MTSNTALNSVHLAAYLRHRIFRRVAMVLPLAVSLLTYSFLLYLHSGQCARCNSSIPPWMVIVSGTWWLVIAILMFSGKHVIAFLAALTASTTHTSIIALSHAQCSVCVFICGVASLTTIVIALLAYSHSKKFMVVLAGVAGVVIGGAGGTLCYNIWLAPMPDRVYGQSKASEGIAIYILVNRNCGNCGALERKLVDAMSKGLSVVAVVVDETSANGASLKRNNGITSVPAYIATQQGRVLQVQEGGSVEQFIKHCKERLQ